MTASGGGVDLLTMLEALSFGLERIEARMEEIGVRQERQDAEQVVMARRVEGILGQLEATPAQPDYRADLVGLRDEVRGTAKVVTAIAALPLHRPGVLEQIAGTFRKAGETLARPLAADLDRHSTSLKSGITEIGRVVASARTRQRQNRWLGAAGGASLLAGLVLYPLAASVLPGGTFLAALATGTVDRWDAGQNLMSVHDSRGNEVVGWMIRLYNANDKALQTCSEAVRAEGQPRGCSVTLREPLPVAPGRTVE